MYKRRENGDIWPRYERENLRMFGSDAEAPTINAKSQHFFFNLEWVVAVFLIISVTMEQPP